MSKSEAIGVLLPVFGNIIWVAGIPVLLFVGASDRNSFLFGVGLIAYAALLHNVWSVL